VSELGSSEAPAAGSAETQTAEITSLRREIEELREALAAAEEQQVPTPKALLESLLVQPDEVIYTAELIGRALASENELVNALGTRLAFEHFLPEDVERLARTIVSEIRVSESGLVAASYLAERITPESRREIEGLFSPSDRMPAGNWLAAATLHLAGDSTWLAIWGDAASREIRGSTGVTPAIQRYLDACRVLPEPDVEAVLLAAADSEIPAIRLRAIPGLGRFARESALSRRALEGLLEDPMEGIRERAAVAMRIVEASQH
jgi:hypothetical protein